MLCDGIAPPAMTAAAIRGVCAHNDVGAAVQRTALPAIAAGILHARLQRDDLLFEQGVLASCAAARHVTSISFRCTSEQRDLVVDRLLRHMTANDELGTEFRKQKEQALRRALPSSWNARFRAEQRMRQELYGTGHAYGWTQAGDYAAIEEVTCGQAALWLEDLRSNLLVIFADQQEVVAVNESADCGNMLPAIGRVRMPTILPQLPRKQVHLTCGSADEACNAAGAIGPSHGDRDFETAQLANLLLGRVGGMGLLGGWYRAHGLAYECGAVIEGGWGPGLWKLHAVFPRKDEEEQPSGIPEILDRFLNSELSENALEAARRMWIQQRLLNRSDAEGRAAFQVQARFLLARQDDWSRETVYSIHAAQVKDVVARYWCGQSAELHLQYKEEQ
jgi:predicted Zn-dependent peptidase